MCDLALDTTENHALCENLLAEEEQQNRRDDHQHRYSHNEMSIDGVDRVEGLQTNCQSPVFAAVQEDQWFVEIIPRVEEVEDSNRDERGTRLRKNNVKQNLQWIRAIYLCSVIEFERNGHKKLAKQEHIIRVRKEQWNDQRQ